MVKKINVGSYISNKVIAITVNELIEEMERMKKSCEDLDITLSKLTNEITSAYNPTKKEIKVKKTK